MKDLIESILRAEMVSKYFYLEFCRYIKDHQTLERVRTLADEEQMHFDTLKEHYNSDYEPDLDDVKSEVKKIFEESLHFSRPSMGVQKLLQIAIEREDKAYRRYKEMMEKETDPEKKKVLQRIADMEFSHRTIFEHELSFESGQPSWFESDTYVRE